MLNMNQLEQPHPQVHPQTHTQAQPHPQQHYAECRPLPAINETFAQFSQHRSSISLLSPLDLSLRTTSNIVPITPPSTPSPPRKRQRLMSEENYLWRPHMITLPLQPTVPHAALVMQPPATTSYFHQHTHTHAHPQHAQHPQTQLGSSSYGLRNFEGTSYDKSNFHGKNNFEQIPASQSSVASTTTSTGGIYVEDETIVLTEDEDETVVSSHDYNEYATDTEGDGDGDADDDDDTIQVNDDDEADLELAAHSPPVAIDNDDEEEVFVDILSNDDDELNDQQSPALRLQAQQLLEVKALKRNELLYEDEELHHQAIDGLAMLFDRDFNRPAKETVAVEPDAAAAAIEEQSQTEKVYMDLSGNSAESLVATTNPAAQSSPPPATAPPYSPQLRKHKTERRRTKLRKHAAIDEETISPVSGTIIRKLRDDEELVVRKGDIDPAFNVVEITEEAKAILASIDNKIGDYLCQLCRTVYDDAFMLAQHRCPRIVHIEYKCSECEKVFNCPANLASHRRWHKPKSEMQSGKKRPSSSNEAAGSNAIPSSKAIGEDTSDGIYPCPQCGKTFRRYAYLKKHQASHQMLENLKSMDFFNAQQQHQQQRQQQQSQVQQTQPAAAAASYVLPRPLYPTVAAKSYAVPQRFPGFPFQPFDQRRYYSLGELYLSQHLERSSAFQYVHANHLRQLTNVANNMLPPLPVK